MLDLNGFSMLKEEHVQVIDLYRIFIDQLVHVWAMHIL